MAPTILAETPVPLFLMSVAKPLVTIAAFVPYAAVVSGKLEKDAGYYNLKPQKWAAIFLAFGAAALLASILIPTWFAEENKVAVLGANRVGKSLFEQRCRCLAEGHGARHGVLGLLEAHHAANNVNLRGV